MGGTQGELGEVSSKPSLDKASQVRTAKGSHQKEEKGPNKLAGGGCNVRFDRGWETLTKRLRDQSLSIRVGARPGSPLPRTRRHGSRSPGKRYELDGMLVAQTGRMR